jgi:hypothetical protein
MGIKRLSRACIVHLVIKRTNWFYVKTMSCSGSHLGIPISIKNTKFVKDLPIIDFNNPKVKLYQKCLLRNYKSDSIQTTGMFTGGFCSDMKSKMVATAGLSLTLDLMGKCFKTPLYLTKIYS